MLDKIIIEIDKILKHVLHTPVARRPYPGVEFEDSKLSVDERKQVISMMRVNHCGEICAQALYQGQALTARDKSHRDSLEHAAKEETDHLAWTLKRLTELNSAPSKLVPVFYLGSLVFGIVAGLCGDKWSLGFLAETELQVEEHLKGHLMRLPLHDDKSQAILEQMKEDERSHAVMAKDCGAAALPFPVQLMMRITSKIMTVSAAYI